MGYALIFGIGIGILYDLFRIARLLFRSGKTAVVAEDIIFFALSALLMSIFLFTFHSGVLRLYIFLCAAAGAALWYMTFGRILYRLWRRAADRIRRCVAVLSAPLRRKWQKTRQKWQEKIQKKRKIKQKSAKKPFLFHKKYSIIEGSKYAYVQKEREVNRHVQKT